MRNMAIMPTSVACEQSFSYFKRTRHINMGDKTAKFFLFARLNHYETDDNFMRDGWYISMEVLELKKNRWVSTYRTDLQ